GAASVNRRGARGSTRSPGQTGLFSVEQRLGRDQERPAGRSVVRGRGGGGGGGGRGAGGATAGRRGRRASGAGRGGRRVRAGGGGGRGRRGRRGVPQRRHAQLATMNQRHLVEPELVVDRVRGLGELAILGLVAGQVIRMTRRGRILVVFAGRRAEQDRFHQRQ